MESTSKKLFEHKVRARVCGILLKDDHILMLKHRGIGKGAFLWSPPGGGIEFEMDARSMLIREFKEETGLEISVGEFLFVNEYQDDRHHAIELFFAVHLEGGELKLGEDPELGKEEQIIEAYKWFSLSDIEDLKPELIHNCFHDLKRLDDIIEKKGFFKFGNISIK